MLQSFMRASNKAKAVELVASATGSGSGGSLVIGKPTGTLQGDIMVAFMIYSDGGNAVTWTGDTGWTEVIDENAPPNIRVAYKIAEASEGSSYTFSLTASKTPVGAIVTLRNGQWDTIGTISTSITASTQTAPSITVGANNSYLLAFFARTGGGATWSNPTSGLTTIASFTGGPAFHLYGDDLYPSGSSGGKSATCNSSTGAFGAVLASIKPS